MFLQLYELAIAPVLHASEARRVVEIGARKGETTVKLLDLLGPSSELHVIDPVPQFDPAEHERRFAGRYHFHRDISHNVLPTLPPVDAALIDGDHNWYTVYNELKMLAASAREAGAPLPLLFLHDVGWPYGRRDLYYAPERIPEQYRQPYSRRGLAPGSSELLDRGGFNQGHLNALHEGGPRNGVMTALEDFIAEQDEPQRLVLVPVLHGLAIVASEARLGAEARLALDRLEGAANRYEQGEFAEATRVMALATAETRMDRARAREHRAANRYLDLLKGALLDEHYLENEVRLEYLHDCLTEGRDLDPLSLRDPQRRLAARFRPLEESRRTGAPVRAIANRPIFPYTTIGRSGLDHLQGCLETIRAEGIPGDLAACGVWRGGSAVFMRGFLDAYQIQEPQIWVAGTFAGPPGSAAVTENDVTATRFPNLVADVNLVRDGFARFGLLDDRVRFVQGRLAEALADASRRDLALVHLGDELQETTAEALDDLYDRVVPGGFVVVAHHDDAACREAVDRFRSDRRIEGPIERVDWTSAAWRKPLEPGSASVAVPPVDAAKLQRAPLAPSVSSSTELSVIVVLHDMRREAMRTLHSLSRSYQNGISDLDYEVLVVENGSTPEQALGQDLVRSFGPHYRYLNLGADSTPSPAPALNRAIAASRGHSLALMIDGAHVLTPGVLHFGMLGLRAYSPAIVMTQQWYLGPGQQPETMDGGYDQEYEDRLLEGIAWPAAGSRLFEIGSPIGERDWFDGLWESNCMFVPRSLLEQVGGFDEAFSMPGGGYVNLDLYERLAASPGVAVVDILGEASFHQLHGGMTTNQPDADELHSRLMSYREHYERVRNRPFRGPGKLRHYVGGMSETALRTRPRWTAPKAFRKAQRVGVKGFPEHPVPIPDDLRTQFTDAFWRSLAWRETTWLGSRVQRPATDLVAYQALIVSVKPDWIIDLRSSGGARGLFFASICDLVGSGEVLAVQPKPSGKRPQHPRLTYLTGDPIAEDTRPRLLEAVGEKAQGLVVIAPAPKRRVVREFTAYASLVPVGSYVIVESTILGGNPVMPEFGQGPGDAVKTILKQRDDFMPDRSLERFGFSFNPRGFLKRVKP